MFNQFLSGVDQGSSQGNNQNPFNSFIRGQKLDSRKSSDSIQSNLISQKQIKSEHFRNELLNSSKLSSEHHLIEMDDFDNQKQQAVHSIRKDSNVVIDDAEVDKGI